MTTQQNDGGPAFPMDEHNEQGARIQATSGMSLRAYIATATLQSLITGSSNTFSLGQNEEINNKRFSKAACIIADALIAELAK